MKSIVLVLLPGLDGTGMLFRPFLSALPAEIRPQGQAYPVDTPTTYEELVPAVLAALPREAPFALLGESYSGPLALMVAARRPTGLRAVILCASFIRNPLPLAPAWLSRFVRPFPFRFFRFFSGVKALLGRVSTPALRRLAAEALAPVQPAVLAARVRSVLSVNVTSELEACNVPVLYLRGEHDHVVLSHNSRRIQEIRAGVRVVSVQAPHLILQTKPEAAARAIVEFLASENAV